VVCITRQGSCNFTLVPQLFTFRTYVLSNLHTTFHFRPIRFTMPLYNNFPDIFECLILFYDSWVHQEFKKKKKTRCTPPHDRASYLSSFHQFYQIGIRNRKAFKVIFIPLLLSMWKGWKPTLGNILRVSTCYGT